MKIEQRMNDIDVRAQAVGEQVEGLAPLLQMLQQNLEIANNELFHHLLQGINVRSPIPECQNSLLIMARRQRSQEQVDIGIASALHLDKMLQEILGAVASGYAEAATIHNQSLQIMNQQATSEVQAMAETMAAVIAATNSLHNQIVRATYI